MVRRVAKPQPEEYLDLHWAVDQLADLKLKRKEAEEKEKDLQKKIIHRMYETQIWSVDTGYHRGTLVEPTRIEIGEAMLKRKLGATLWKRITKTILDRDLLEHEMAAGNVDPKVVAMCSEEVPIAPYIKIS
jgi:hypothetical protein